MFFQLCILFLFIFFSTSEFFSAMDDQKCAYDQLSQDDRDAAEFTSMAALIKSCMIKRGYIKDEENLLVDEEEYCAESLTIYFNNLDDLRKAKKYFSQMFDILEHQVYDHSITRKKHDFKLFIIINDTLADAARLLKKIRILEAPHGNAHEQEQCSVYGSKYKKGHLWCIVGETMSLEFQKALPRILDLIEKPKDGDPIDNNDIIKIKNDLEIVLNDLIDQLLTMFYRQFPSRMYENYVQKFCTTDQKLDFLFKMAPNHRNMELYY